MKTVSEITLEELRAHRGEFHQFRQEMNTRVASLEITRAEDKGSKRAWGLIGGATAGGLSLVVTIWSKVFS